MIMAKGCLILIPGINSITHKERLTESYDFPRGGLSLASFLHSKGKRVHIVPLDYYLPNIKNPTELVIRMRHVIHSAVKDFDPALIGIGSPYTILYPTLLKIATFCKEVSDAVVCLGGVHVTYMHEQVFLDSNNVDVVVRGEGEWTLLELLEKIEAGVDYSSMAGVTVRNTKFGKRDNGSITVNPPRPIGNMAELPMMKYDLLPERLVRNMTVTIVGSRGCPYKCSYCVESAFWGQKVRANPMNVLVEEAKILTQIYNNPPIAFEDSMFHMKSRRFYELCDQLKSIRLHPDFYILSRVDSLTDEGFKAMKEAGINKIIFGLESASPKVQAIMNKNITYAQMEEACRRVTNAGLRVGSFWIIGHPGDTPQEAGMTLDAIKRLYSIGCMEATEISMFIPYPGTVIFENQEEYGIEILSHDWEKWGRFNTEPVCQLKEFRKDDILKYWIKAQRLAEYWMAKRAYNMSFQRPVV